MKQPPSLHVNLKGALQQHPELVELAKIVLLQINKVKIWLQHMTTVATNRKRGAAKAAETSHRKGQGKERQKEPDTVHCGVCSEQYKEITD